MVAGGAADADSGVPADLNARAPPAPDDGDDGLPTSAIIAIVIPAFLLLLLCCAAAAFLLLRRRSRQRGVAAREAAKDAANVDTGESSDIATPVGPVSGLPWDKASIRVRAASVDVCDTLSAGPRHSTHIRFCCQQQLCHPALHVRAELCALGRQR